MGAHAGLERAARERGGGRGSQGTCIVLADQNVGNALGAVRQLGRHGVRVLLVGPPAVVRAAGASRHCYSARVVQEQDPEAYVEAVLKVLESSVPGYDSATTSAVPLSDRLVELLDGARDRWTGRLQVALPPSRAVKELIAKDASVRIAQQAGLRVPAWQQVRDGADIGGTERLRLPVIVKPLAWSTRGARPFKLNVVNDRAELTALLRDCVDAGAAVVVQEYVRAPESACEFGLIWRSRLTGETRVCTGTKMRHSHRDGGVLAFGESEDRPDVRRAAIDFAVAADFVGVGGIEFIRQGDVLWFVEFNPRPEAFHALAETSCVPLVWLLHRELIGAGGTPSAEAKQAAIWVGTAWLERVRHSPRSAALLLPDILRFLGHRRRAWAVWDRNDPFPWVWVTANLLRAAVTSRARLLIGRQSRDGASGS